MARFSPEGEGAKNLRWVVRRERPGRHALPGA